MNIHRFHVLVIQSNDILRIFGNVKSLGNDKSTSVAVGSTRGVFVVVIEALDSAVFFGFSLRVICDVMVDVVWKSIVSSVRIFISTRDCLESTRQTPCWRWCRIVHYKNEGRSAYTKMLFGKVRQIKRHNCVFRWKEQRKQCTKCMRRRRTTRVKRGFKGIRTALRRSYRIAVRKTV